ncbi:MAG: hypothetical protein HKN87_11650 [Saprospiraceae bacterium]|nr:hypothetical protein [Saprospiraceae bacterium]
MRRILPTFSIWKVYSWSDQGDNSAPMGLAKAKIYNCARIGYLYLNIGMWKGQQVIPKEWISQTTLGTPANPHYGFFWWNMHDRITVPHDTYFTYGRWGQFIVIISSLAMVVVHSFQWSKS